jgi:hypothetical protein
LEDWKGGREGRRMCDGDCNPLAVESQWSDQ